MRDFQLLFKLNSINSTRLNFLLVFSLWGIECELLTAAQCKEKCSIIETDDLLGGIWIPKDGVAHPKYICDSLISEACGMGVTVIEKCTVKEVAQRQNLISSVRTNLGRVNCEYFVNCGGFWARAIGKFTINSVVFTHFVGLIRSIFQYLSFTKKN